MKLVKHPNKPLTPFRKLSFREWAELREGVDLKALADHDKIDISKYDMDELKMGFEVEKEHGSKLGKDTNVTKDCPYATLKIAIAHLKEDPKYYTKLKKIDSHH